MLIEEISLLLNHPKTALESVASERQEIDAVKPATITLLAKRRRIASLPRGILLGILLVMALLTPSTRPAPARAWRQGSPPGARSSFDIRAADVRRLVYTDRPAWRIMYKVHLPAPDLHAPPPNPPPLRLPDEEFVTVEGDGLEEVAAAFIGAGRAQEALFRARAAKASPAAPATRSRST
jgi:hypothetical protein